MRCEHRHVAHLINRLFLLRLKHELRKIPMTRRLTGLNVAAKGNITSHPVIKELLMYKSKKKKKHVSTCWCRRMINFGVITVALIQ